MQSGKRSLWRVAPWREALWQDLNRNCWFLVCAMTGRRNKTNDLGYPPDIPVALKGIEVDEEERVLWIGCSQLYNCLDADVLQGKVKNYFNRQRKTKRKQKRPLAVLVYGLPGSGKSTIMQGKTLKHAITGYENCVLVDRAILEEQIDPPGYTVQKGDVKGTELENLTGYTVKSMAAFGACESLAEKQYEEGLASVMKDRYSFALHLHSGVAELLIELKEKGYQTVVVWMEVAPEVSMSRARSRAKKNGLFLSKDYLSGYRKWYGKRKQLFAGYARLADAWVIVDNNGRTPRVDSFSSTKRNLITPP